MHLYVVVEKWHAIFDINREKGRYIKHANSLWLLPSLDTWNGKDLNKDAKMSVAHVSSDTVAVDAPFLLPSR